MLFPIVVVPIGHAQLQTVLRFYTTHAELRGELATGQGLQRVRAFMAAPDLVGEGVGDAVVPEQVRGGGPEQVRGGSVLPAPEPTRPIDASPSPVSPRPIRTPRTGEHRMRHRRMVRSGLRQQCRSRRRRSAPR